MRNRRAVLACFVLTILFSVPSFMAIPSVSPFLLSNVRQSAPQAISMLREQGIWLVNATFDHVERTEDQICFMWKHAYQSRLLSEDPKFLTTCIDEEK